MAREPTGIERGLNRAAGACFRVGIALTLLVLLAFLLVGGD